MPTTFDPDCAARYMGLWLHEPTRFRSASHAVLAGIQAAVPKTIRDENGDGVYSVDRDGIAFIRITGPTQKFDSKFGGTNSVRVRRALRMAEADRDVVGAMMMIDSPGGTVAGTEELARDVAAFARQKPIVAHIDDLGASAAMWIAAQANRITANETALVGSIGTIVVMHDLSEMARLEGIRTIVIASDGAEQFKGAGVEGTEITEEQIEYWRGLVNDTNDLFLAAIASGRKMSADRVRKLADGRVHMAAAAQGLGLIDAVESADDARSALIRMVKDSGQRRSPGRNRRTAAAQVARLRMGG